MFHPKTFKAFYAFFLACVISFNGVHATSKKTNMVQLQDTTKKRSLKTKSVKKSGQKQSVLINSIKTEVDSVLNSNRTNKKGGN